MAFRYRVLPFKLQSPFIFAIDDSAGVVLGGFVVWAQIVFPQILGFSTKADL